MTKDREFGIQVTDQQERFITPNCTECLLPSPSQAEGKQVPVDWDFDKRLATKLLPDRVVCHRFASNGACYAPRAQLDKAVYLEKTELPRNKCSKRHRNVDYA